MEFPPYRVPSKEEYEAVENMIVDLDVKHFKENVDFGKSYFKPGPFIDVIKFHIPWLAIFFYDVRSCYNCKHFFLLFGILEQVFDAKRLRRHPPKNESVVPLHLKEDPSLFQILAKCAMLAIGDYNSQTKSDYRFVDIEMATWQLVAGTLYHITFQSRNAEKKYQTFEATVLIDMCMREVQRIRIKGSDTW
jgi:hypothetical protein